MLRHVTSRGGANEAVSCPASSLLSQFSGPIRIGRHTNCEIRCLSQQASSEKEVINAAISRWHAEVSRTTDGDYVLRDTSANGVMVNGHRINGTHTLKSGDVIILGMPTYKVNLEATTEVANPFVFEYTAEEDFSRNPAEAPSANQSPLDGVPNLDRDNCVLRPPSRNFLCQQVLTDQLLDHGRGRSQEVPDLNKQPDSEMQEGHARLRVADTVAGSSHGLDLESKLASRKNRKAARDGQGCERGQAPASRRREFIDLDDLPDGEVPEAATEQGVAREGPGSRLHRIGSRRKQAGDSLADVQVPKTSASIGNVAEGGRLLGEADENRPGGLFEEEEGGRSDEGRELVRHRLMELVRAKARADERQGPSKKRSLEADTLAEELLRKMTRLKRAVANTGPPSGVRNTQTATPTSLADDCPLLEVPELGGGARNNVQRWGQDMAARPTLDPVRSLVIEVPGTLPPAPEQASVAPEQSSPPGFLRAEAASKAESPAQPSETTETPSEASENHVNEELLEMLGEEMQCVICQNFLCAAHALPCSHTFCGDCLTKWITKQPHCPTCRQPLRGANPTPIHNIDSMIERAASKCMSGEEKAEFDRRRDAFKTSKKLKPPPGNTAAAASGRSARAPIRPPGHILDAYRSGTIQAITARVEEAMSGLSDDARARALFLRANQSRRQVAASNRRTVSSVVPVAAPPLQAEVGLAVRAASQGALYVIDIPQTGDTRCTMCRQLINEGRFRLSNIDEPGRYHLGCLKARGMIQPWQVAGLDELSPEDQERAQLMLRAPGAIIA